MRSYVGLQIRHPGFESRRRLSCASAVLDGKKASNASDSFDLGSPAFFVAHYASAELADDLVHAVTFSGHLENLLSGSVRSG